MSRRSYFTRPSLAAAAHEIRCRECRVTWCSWLARLVGLRSGYAPSRVTWRSWLARLVDKVK